jgi:hypothetical protein
MKPARKARNKLRKRDQCGRKAGADTGTDASQSETKESLNRTLSLRQGTAGFCRPGIDRRDAGGDMGLVTAYGAPPIAHCFSAHAHSGTAAAAAIAMVNRIR